MSCLCFAQQSDELTAPTNLTSFSLTAAACCRTMRDTSRAPTPDRDRKRRLEKEKARQQIPRVTIAAPQQPNKVIVHNLCSHLSGVRHRASVSYSPAEATINGALHRLMLCPDPPLVFEATTQMWNPLHNA